MEIIISHKINNKEDFSEINKINLNKIKQAYSQINNNNNLQLDKTIISHNSNSLLLVIINNKIIIKVVCSEIITNNNKVIIYNNRVIINNNNNSQINKPLFLAKTINNKINKILNKIILKDFLDKIINKINNHLKLDCLEIITKLYHLAHKQQLKIQIRLHNKQLLLKNHNKVDFSVIKTMINHKLKLVNKVYKVEI